MEKPCPEDGITPQLLLLHSLSPFPEMSWNLCGGDDIDVLSVTES